MNKHRAFGATFALVALTVALVAVPLAAQAAPDPTPSPGDGYQYGWGQADFPQAAEQNVHGQPNACSPTGGYQTEAAWPSDGTPSAGSGSRSLAAVKACEPWYGLAYGVYGFQVDISMTQLADYRDPQSSGAFADAGVIGSAPFRYTCGSAQWNPPGTTWTVNGSANGSMQGDLGLPNDFTYHAPILIDTPRNCPFLVSFTFTVGTYHGFSSARTAHTILWTALQAVSPRSYINGSAATVACGALNATPDMSPSCAGVFALDPAHACDNPPAAPWSSFDWVGVYVGFYAKCLFVPLGGFDRGGWVSTAFANSSVSRVTTALSSAVTAFEVAPGMCGVIAPGAVSGPWSNFHVNTCEWPQLLTSNLRVIIGWALVIASSYWMIFFVIRTTLGLLNQESSVPDSSGPAEK